MADATYTDFLVQEAEKRHRARLRQSVMRTVIGFALFGVAVYLSFQGRDAAYFMAGLTGIASFLMLAGFTPRIVRNVTIIAMAPIYASPAYQDQSRAIRLGMKNGTVASPTLSDLKRRLKILFLSRMLGVVGLLMIVVILQWQQQRAFESEHGTTDAVHLQHNGDGAEIKTPLSSD